MHGEFKHGEEYNVKLLSSKGDVVTEERCCYHGMDSGRHVFKYTTIYMNNRWQLILIPESLLDRYDIRPVKPDINTPVKGDSIVFDSEYVPPGRCPKMEYISHETMERLMKTIRRDKQNMSGGPSITSGHEFSSNGDIRYENDVTKGEG